MNKIGKLIFSIFLLFVVSGCNSIREKEAFEQMAHPISVVLNSEYKTVPMNSAMSLQFYEIVPIINDFKSGSDVNLLLINDSPKNIWFSSQEGINLYQLMDDQYIQINDQISRYLAQPIALLSGYELPFSVNPEIHSDKSTNILIVVTGIIMDDENLTDQIVGAYIECTLEQ